MKTLFRLVFGGLFLCGWGLAALSLHVIRTPTSIGLIPKDRLGVVDTYVDTRKWTLNDAADHPLVVSRVLATGQLDLLRHINGDSDGDLQKELTKAVRHSHYRESTTTAVSSTIDVTRTSTAVKQWWAMR